LAWVGVTLLAVSAPVAWSLSHPPPPVPEVINLHWVPGKVTVVEISDFECFYCRRNHALLSQFVQEKGAEIAFVRLVKPLHSGGNGQLAAKTYWFAAAKGKAEEMADALFSASDLTSEGCENLVRTMGLDPTEYRVYMAAPETGRKVSESTAELEWVQGLPTIWVQDRMLLGEQTRESLEMTYKRASNQRVRW
jgi:predicted DsbA family dithiol-disulfide isomerase